MRPNVDASSGLAHSSSSSEWLKDPEGIDVVQLYGNEEPATRYRLRGVCLFRKKGFY